ncbi:packaged DNA stabilization protein [Paraburkholderia caballeronis]|uniref:packaged DNA stabilization protein n=1 Tax=Paraburkholderia caballeronis TaxID=416943 RepID=UPI001064F3C1|nr:packaged DNA stabilization protein [Paraburkholderia caballeronis]TDV06065.1 phage stabilization protein [Paraburkholderia caballeronis]TDV09605.1 phage stabilization protein [Paraburkholderia caballeronis]TDV21670.1 phage stabilization protein [Paraburkholderia caballeronis]
MQIPLASGTYTDAGAEFRTSYPRNLVPVIKNTGISKLFLRSAEGLTRFDVSAPTLDGFDRGGINWRGTCYRVIGTNFVSVDATGAVTVLGQVPDDGYPVAMAYGYTNQGIGIVSAKTLWFYTIQTPSGGTNPTPTLQPVTDSNLGKPIDLLWMAGYFVMTDGTYCFVTQLANQFTLNSQLYGSSSNQPDALNCVWKFRNELYLGNRYQIPVMDNEGGTGFPFVENEGATIQKGVIGPYAKAITSQGFAFVGGAQDEAPSVWLSAGLGIATKIATREVEIALAQYAEAQLYFATLEYRAEKEQQFIYLHLPDYTLVYDVASSQAAQEPLWFLLDSSADGTGAWRAWHPVYCYGKFLMGDKIDQRIGFIDPATAAQYGTDARWQFDTIFAYNQTHGVVVNALELVGTYGRAAVGESDTMSMQYTDDGLVWSAPRFISMGAQGKTKKRAQWRPKHFFRNFRGYRFAGFNSAPISFAALEATPEPLSA